MRRQLVELLLITAVTIIIIASSSTRSTSARGASIRGRCSLTLSFTLIDRLALHRSGTFPRTFVALVVVRTVVGDDVTRRANARGIDVERAVGQKVLQDGDADIEVDAELGRELLEDRLMEIALDEDAYMPFAPDLFDFDEFMTAYEAGVDAIADELEDGIPGRPRHTAAARLCFFATDFASQEEADASLQGFPTTSSSPSHLPPPPPIDHADVRDFRVAGHALDRSCTVVDEIQGRLKPTARPPAASLGQSQRAVKAAKIVSARRYRHRIIPVRRWAVVEPLPTVLEDIKAMSAPDLKDVQKRHRQAKKALGLKAVEDELAAIRPMTEADIRRSRRAG